MSNYSLVLYKKENGKVPIQEFYDELSAGMKAKLIGTFDLLAEFGPLIRAPYSKYLTDGIFELRVQKGNNIIRVFYFFEKNKVIILTNGYIKKTQKTDSLEISRAIQYRDDYRKRCSND